MNAKYKRKTQNNSDFQTGFALGNLYRNTKAELNAIGAASGGEFSAHELARRMAALLLSETGGEILGDTEYLPEMWAQPSGRPNDSEAVAAEALHVRPHGGKALKRKRYLSPKAIAGIKAAQRKRWRNWRKAKAAKAKGGKKNHASWADFKTPEERSAEMRRRMQKARALKQAA